MTDFAHCWPEGPEDCADCPDADSCRTFKANERLERQAARAAYEVSFETARVNFAKALYESVASFTGKPFCLRPIANPAGECAGYYTVSVTNGRYGIGKRDFHQLGGSDVKGFETDLEFAFRIAEWVEL